MMLCSNDAKACYDQVIHSIAIIAMVRAGAPYINTKLVFQTLQQAKHRIRTAYGSLDVQYQSTPGALLQGIGQDNGCAPAGWNNETPS